MLHISSYSCSPYGRMRDRMKPQQKPKTYNVFHCRLLLKY